MRDLYDLPPDPAHDTPRILIVATDRISAFDVVMPTPIVGKGRLLTEISLRWFRFIEDRNLATTHLLSTDPKTLVGLGSPPITHDQASALEGRIMIARRCRVVPIECVARGYLDGSGWAEYQKTGRICGVHLPAGLRRGDKLPQPIFTPATKEAVGTHDENIDFDRACTIAGRDVMEQLRTTTLAIYSAAHDYAAERGLILADTKFEFGFPIESGATTGEVNHGGTPRAAVHPTPILCDEALTPDSSRYWDASHWKPGGEQPSFDKQYLREYLNALTSQGEWNKRPPGPPLPTNVVDGTQSRYNEVARRLFGTEEPTE